MADGKFAIRVEVQQAVAKDFAKIEKQVDDFRASILKLNNRLAKTNKELATIKKQNALKSQGDQASFFASQMGTAIKKLIAYRTVFLTLRGLKDIFKDTLDDVVKIDAVLSDLNKVLGTTEENLIKLRTAAFAFAKEFGKNINDVTAGFKIFAQQGLNTNEIIERTRILMIAISATTLTANQAVEALTAATRNFNVEGIELLRVVDAWKAVESSAAVGAQDLANAMKQLAQVASVAGVSLDFLNGITAAVASVTRKSGQAIGTSYRTIFARLQSNQAIQAFQDLGVNVLNARGELRPMEGLLKDLAVVWDDLSDGQKRNIALLAGGKRRYSDFLALMNNFDAAVESANTSQNAFGEATIAAQINTQKLEARLQKVTSAWQELRVVVGEEAVRAFVNAVEGIVPFLETLTENSEAVADLIKNLGILFGILGAVGAFLLAKKAVLALVVAIKAAVVGAVSLGAAIVALGPLLIALGAIVVAGVAIYETFQDINEATKASTKETDELTAALKRMRGEVEETNKTLTERQTLLDKVNKQFALEPDVILAEEKRNTLLQERARIQAELNRRQAEAAADPHRETDPDSLVFKAQEAEAEKLRAELRRLDGEIFDITDSLTTFRAKLLAAALAQKELDDKTKIALINLEKMKSTIKILSEADVLEAQFNAAAEQAERVNEPFDELKVRLDQLTGIQKKFSDGIISAQTKLSELNRQLKTQDEANLLIDTERDAIKLKIATTEAQIANLLKAQKEFNADNADEVERLVFLLEKQKKIIEALPLAQFERNTGVRQEIAGLKQQQALQEAILDSSLDQEAGLLAIQQTKIRLAEQEAQIKINDLQTEIDRLKVLDENNDVTGLINKQELIRRQLAAQILGIEQDTTTELARQKIERDAALRSQIANNLIALPDFLTQRIEDERLLEQERAQAEQRLAEARAANDAAAIERAQADIDDIENRIRDLASIAGTVAESFLKPFSDLFVERTMQEFVDTIYNLRNAGGELSDIFSGKETSDQVSKAISDASSKGASRFNAAIEAGARAGALLLGQVLGGGGRGAGIGAAIGGAFGGLLGPLGSIGGSLVGGLIGGLFDQDKKITAGQSQRLSDAIDKNTLAIENNNRLLELNREFINAPTRFEAPSTRGSAFGIGDINVTVNAGSGGGVSPADIGNGVADVIEKRLGSALRATGSRASKLGNR